ncbi:hydroxyisourate hydrolase [soil metagenome]
MSAITTHVLDTAIGRPAAGVAVVLERWSSDEQAIHEGGHTADAGHVDDGAGSRFNEVVGSGFTDDDGRLRDLAPAGPLPAGTYRLRFDTGGYYAARGIDGFYPEVAVSFLVSGGDEHYHVPLLLSPYGYSTYRGS